jgi:hypothetical protein
MVQKLRFGLVLGRLAVCTEKNNWADCEQLLRVGFSCFQGQNNVAHNGPMFKNIVASALALHNTRTATGMDATLHTDF